MASLQGVTLPWTENNALLDLDYIYRWSGYKSISPLVRHLQGDDDHLSNSAYATLAGIIWAHYGTAWTKKYNALVEDYNPLENYNMIEHEDAEITDDSLTSTVGSAAANKITDNSTTTGSESGRHTATNTSSHNVYGYNSNSAVPSESDSGSLTETTNNSTSETTNATRSQSTDIDTNYDNTRGIDRTLTRSGNIGVTTSQMMLESELQLRAYRFFEEVYKDVDRITALPIYDGEITGQIYTESSGTSGVSVTSVNGKTGAVTLYGSDIDLTSLISTSVAQAISNLNTGKANKPTVLTTTLAAGSTTASITDASIGDNSNIDIYFNKSGVKMTGWTQVSNTFTMTFEAYTDPVLITLEVYNG